MSRHLGSIVLEDNYEGLGTLGGQQFLVKKGKPSVNDLVVVTNGDRSYEDYYRNGEVYKVTEVDALGIIFADGTMDNEGTRLFFFNDEVSILEPITFLGRMYVMFYSNGGWVNIIKKAKHTYKGVRSC